jgi:hypothetical protein
MWCDCVREGRPGALKKGEAMLCMMWCSRIGGRARRVLTYRRGQQEWERLHQEVCEGGSWSEARGLTRRWAVGLERGCRMQACQVFVESTSIRTRPGEAERKNTKSKSCLGRLKYASGRLVARWLGQRCRFHKWDMSMAC